MQITQFYINSVDSCLKSDYLFERELTSRIAAFVSPLFELLAGMTFLLGTALKVFVMPLKALIFIGCITAQETKHKKTEIVLRKILEICPTFYSLMQTACKSLICFANIIVSPFIGFVRPKVNIFWHVECGLATMPIEKKQAKSRNSALKEIAGMEEVKQIFEQQILKPLKDPKTCREYDIKIPSGILFYGPPGCGKTHIISYLAETSGYPIEKMEISNIGSSLMHATPAKIKEIFEKAFAQAPSVITLDEVESMIPKRQNNDHSTTQAHNEEIATFLQCLEKCAEKNVIVLAATNLPQNIDPAILRPGRFDKKIYIGPPDEAQRTQMIKFKLSKIQKKADNIDCTQLAKELDGYSASDINLIFEEAKIRAAFLDKSELTAAMLLEEAKKVRPSLTKSIVEGYSQEYRKCFAIAADEKPAEFPMYL